MSYYIDKDKDLSKYYISIFNINGAHGLVYHPLIKLLKVPTLIITDLDIGRTVTEEDECTQVSDLKNKVTTNPTIAKYNNGQKNIENISGYFGKDNLKVVFQYKNIEGYFATSFEESFILTNYSNNILNKVLDRMKPTVYSEIVGTKKDINKIKDASYKLQSKLSKSKSDFANELLYEMSSCDDAESKIPILPTYITCP